MTKLCAGIITPRGVYVEHAPSVTIAEARDFHTAVETVRSTHGHQS